jgi:hypothetical protein
MDQYDLNRRIKEVRERELKTTISSYWLDFKATIFLFFREEFLISLEEVLQLVSPRIISILSLRISAIEF